MYFFEIYGVYFLGGGCKLDMHVNPKKCPLFKTYSIGMWFRVSFIRSI